MFRYSFIDIAFCDVKLSYKHSLNLMSWPRCLLRPSCSDGLLFVSQVSALLPLTWPLSGPLLFLFVFIFIFIIFILLVHVLQESRVDRVLSSPSFVFD